MPGQVGHGQDGGLRVIDAAPAGSQGGGCRRPGTPVRLPYRTRSERADHRRINALDTAWSARVPGKLFKFGRALAQVLCHTRELAFQICNEFERFSRYLPDIKTKVFYGGVPVAEHKRILKSECPHIIVGTPGRVLQLVREKELATKGISACSANDPCLAFAPEDR